MGKMMSKLLNGLSTKLFNLFLYFFGVRKKPTYSTTLDDGYVLKEIPEAFPALQSEHVVASDLGDFRVVSIDKEKSIITVREINTELDYQFNVDAFDAIFVKKNANVEPVAQ